MGTHDEIFVEEVMGNQMKKLRKKVKDFPLDGGKRVSLSDLFIKELEQCSDLEKQQLIEILKIIRMKPAVV